jgi:WD40 repeat protein
LHDKVSVAALSPDGRLIATASRQDVLLWDRASGEQTGTLPAQDSDVWELYFETADQLIAVSKTSLRVWDLNGPTLALEFSAEAGKQICGWQFTPNEDLHKAVVVGTSSVDNSVGRPRVDTRSMGNHQHLFLASPQCSLLSAIPLASFAFGKAMGLDMRISAGSRVQSVIIGEDQNLFFMDSQGGFRLLPTGNEKYGLALLTPDGNQAAAVTSDKVVIWDVRNAVRLVDLPSFGKSILSMNFSADGQLLFLALGDNSVQVWARESSGEMSRVIDTKAGGDSGPFVSEGCDHFDDKVLTDHTNVGRQFSSHDHAGNTQYTLGDTSWRVRDVEFSIDGRQVIVVAQPADRPVVKRLLTFDAGSGKLVGDLAHEFGEGTQCVRLGADGRRIALLDEKLFRLFDTSSKELKREIRSDNGVRFLAEAFNSNGAQIATYRSDGTLSLVDSAFGDTVDEAVRMRRVRSASAAARAEAGRLRQA